MAGRSGFLPERPSSRSVRSPSAKKTTISEDNFFVPPRMAEYLQELLVATIIAQPQDHILLEFCVNFFQKKRQIEIDAGKRDVFSPGTYPKEVSAVDMLQKRVGSKTPKLRQIPESPPNQLKPTRSLVGIPLGQTKSNANRPLPLSSKPSEWLSSSLSEGIDLKEAGAQIVQTAEADAIDQLWSTKELNVVPSISVINSEDSLHISPSASVVVPKPSTSINEQQKQGLSIVKSMVTNAVNVLLQAGELSPSRPYPTL